MQDGQKRGLNREKNRLLHPEIAEPENVDAVSGAIIAPPFRDREAGRGEAACGRAALSPWFSDLRASSKMNTGALPSAS